MTEESVRLSAPLAGACLRPLGHLSVAASNKANGLGRKGNLPLVTLRSEKPSLQFLADKNENEPRFRGALRTRAVQPVRNLFPPPDPHHLYGERECRSTLCSF
jgi:hypothetical protein